MKTIFIIRCSILSIYGKKRNFNVTVICLYKYLKCCHSMLSDNLMLFTAYINKVIASNLNKQDFWIWKINIVYSF